MSDKILMNFYIPKHMKHELNEVCDERGLTQTGFILTSIEPRIREWKDMRYRQEMSGTRYHENLPDFCTTTEMEVSGDW